MINFPYTNFHRLNMDAIIKKIEVLEASVKKVAGSIEKIPTKLSQLVNDMGFINTSQAIAAAPVKSVNGETGDVQISVPAASTSNPVMDGTVAIGTSEDYARADHRHPKDTTKANLASPTFTGTPKAPTAASGTNTTQLATTAFVQQELTALEDITPIFTDLNSGITIVQSFANKCGNVYSLRILFHVTAAISNGETLFAISNLPQAIVDGVLLIRSASTSTICAVNMGTSSATSGDIKFTGAGTIAIGNYYTLFVTYVGHNN